MKPVTAAGGIVYRHTEDRDVEVVLIYRRGVWDLPKGKLEEGETIKECARREVAEEIGLESLPEIEEGLSSTYHVYERDGIDYGKTTHWFLMKIEDDSVFSPQSSEDIELVEWTPLQEAQQKAGYENLKKVLIEFKAMYLKMY